MLSRQLCFPGSLSPTSKSMTRQSEPLTWRYKLPLIIPAARQALGAPSGEQLCPLTSLHFSCFKGFSPHPNLKFPCLVDPRSFLFPPNRPGTSGVSMARALGRGGEHQIPSSPSCFLFPVLRNAAHFHFLQPVHLQYGAKAHPEETSLIKV